MFALYEDIHREEHNIQLYSLFRRSPPRVDLFGGNIRFPFGFRSFRTSKEGILQTKMAV